MAQSSSDSNLSRHRALRLNTDQRIHSENQNNLEYKKPQWAGLFATAEREPVERTTATPPIEIPRHHSDDVEIHGEFSPETANTLAERFLRERQPSISFNDEVKTSTGQRHSILEPVRKASRDARGRSMAQALSQARPQRAHSESDRSHYDPLTGRHLPQYSNSPPDEEPKAGEARFPLLQNTVDELARHHSRDIPQPLSMTSDSTMSPVEEAVVTPSEPVSSPLGISPFMARHLSTSYESPRPRSQRKASERWRDGETAPDFFSRAGSLKRSDRDPVRRANRRDTNNSGRSPRSAASSFLRGFSMSSGGDDTAPLPIDSEGATVGEDYVLGKQIGYGGFSIIREVKQMSSQTGAQRTLAVKIVKKQIDGKTKSENDAAQSEFEHEVDLWRLLNHKHILSLEAVYELKEATFCFIPLNTGGTLFDLISNNRQGLPVETAANYAYQLASALRYLHLDARVVHRDIKLENCLVDSTQSEAGSPGLLRVCDFGLAEWISNDDDSVASGSSEHERSVNKFFGPAGSSTSAFAGGSLEYAAPEILRIATSSSGNVHPRDVPPEKSIISPALDIWAMGICIFALLMGRRPFQDSFQPRIVMAILAGDWNKHSLKEKAGDDGYRVVRNCLMMDPLRRPGIADVIESSWFDDARSVADGSDAGSESARASGWRL